MRKTRPWVTIAIVVLGVAAGIGVWMLLVRAQVALLVAPQLKFTIVLEPGFQGELLLVEDPSLPIDYDRDYTLVQSGNTLPVPAGFINKPVFYRSVKIQNKSGELLSRGDFPPPGQIALIGDYMTSERKDGVTSGGTSGIYQYFVFGPQPVE